MLVTHIKMLPFNHVSEVLFDEQRRNGFFLEQSLTDTTANGIEQLEVIRFNRSYQSTDVARMVDLKGGVQKLTQPNSHLRSLQAGARHPHPAI